MIAPQQTLNLLSTNVPDNTESVYDAATTYNIGDMVQLDDKLYECAADNTVGVNPPDDPITWLYKGAVNKMAMFDAYMNTETSYSGDIVVELGASDADAIGLFGLTATKVKVQVYDNTSASEIYNETIDLEITNITDWWEWSYNAPEYKRDIYLELPLAYDAKITVTIYALDGTAKCSHLSYGRTQSLGATLWGAAVSRRSNINKQRSADGHVYLSQGVSWKRMTLPVSISTGNIDAVEKRLGDIDGLPTMFIGDERDGGFESLLIFGFFRDFDIPISVTKSKYTIEIEGVG